MKSVYSVDTKTQKSYLKTGLQLRENILVCLRKCKILLVMIHAASNPNGNYAQRRR